ncbi:hypothetical protein F2Q70_00012084 [Brassica cretica]|uniref:Uncharacterized protein n=1 Tax=Brassica cretica TaxID=69181 RepID=A0A8S9M821_BRACR|nr:hypothetical protein F2Q70_00012084 [Brassica cretica]
MSASRFGLNALRNPSQPSKTSTDNIIEKYEDAPEPMQVDHATVGRTLRKNNEKVPKHLKRGTNDKEMDSFTKRILRIPMDKPFEEAYFTTFCYFDHGTELESETGASVDTQPRVLIDEKSGATIDRAIEALIDRDPANEIDDFPEGYINSWENDYYQPSFTIHTATPSKRKMSATMEYHGFAMEEEGVLRTSHEAKGETSIERHSSWNRIRRKSRNCLYEFGQRAYDHSGNERFHRETRDEYGIYRDEHGHARAVDGRIIHCQTLTAEQRLMTWYMGSIDPRRCHWMTPTRGSMMSTTQSMTALTGLDERGFFPEDISKSTHARLGIQQHSISNLQKRMHADEVDKEILENQWTRGDEAIRIFVGKWF